MHTFFVNTTGKEIESYTELLEIQHETRNLVTINCPIATWRSEEEGYKHAAQKMGELIDSYKEIDNSYNLILYVDLIAVDAYTSISYDRHRERYACLRAMNALFARYFSATLLKELRDCGREPMGTIIIFEENRRPEDGQNDISEDGKNMLRQQLRRFLGLPENQILHDTVAQHFADSEKADPARYVQQIAPQLSGALVNGILECYPDQIDIFLQEAKNYEVVDEPLRRFLDRVIEQFAADDRDMKSVSFETNRRAGIVNKQERARRDLRLCFYLLDCVYNRTVYTVEKSDTGFEICKGRPFPDMTGKWDTIIAALNEKKAIYKRRHREAVSLSDSYAAIKLAPPLYQFDHDRFGMDAFGAKGRDLLVVDDTEPEEQQNPDGTSEGTPLVMENQKAVVAAEKNGRKLFSRDQYQPFDYKMEEPDKLRSGASVDEYIEQAKKVRTHHINYLKKLKVHVSDKLSNYAGRSIENDPALLTKRKVSVAEEDFDDAGRDYKYAKVGRPTETQRLSTVKTIADTAYTTAKTEYLKFCAGRSVAISDIEEQCNWFVTRIYQITASLKRLKFVALGTILALVVLYLPFFVIQWEQITANVGTILYALGAFGVPFGLAVGIFIVLSILQRKMYKKAWREFKDKSDAILEENSVNAEKFDQLLAILIPSLRWVYEYKLDVEFNVECCNMARAKIGHHIQKMHDRTVAIGNILEDLEYKSNLEESGIVVHDELDYNVAYCSGKTNRVFYAIVEKDLLDAITK